MRAYILRRLLQSVVVLVAISYFLQYLWAVMPGDPVAMLAAGRPGMKKEDIAQLRKERGLDDPVPIRYMKWVRLIARGDMGYSRTYKLPVRKILGQRILNSLKIEVAALLISLIIAIPIGIGVALKPYSWVDYGVNGVTFAGISIPSFWLGIMAIYIFAVQKGWLPPGGMEAPRRGASRFEWWQYYILPVAVLSVQTIAIYIRYMRASMLEVIKEDYVRTARAKGVKPSRVVFQHALRNALIPIITLLALAIPSLFSGALVTETVFSWPGMGRMLYDSVINQDVEVAQVSFLFIAALTLAFNLAADLLYAVVDPRIRLQ